MLWLLLISLWAKETMRSEAVLPPPDIVIEASLPSAKVINGKITLSNGLSYTVVSEESHELKHNLNDLSPSDVETFKKRRIERLVWMAKYLSYGGLSSGLGYMENNQISMLKDGNLTGNPMDIIADLEKEKMSPEKLSRRNQVITKILDHYDSSTFKNSKSFVGGKEYCLDLYIAPMSVMGFGKYIVGGSYGFNIVVGFDWKTKRVSFQLKKVVEIAKFGATFIPLGLNLRAGVFSRSLEYAPKTFDVTYIPAIPGYKVDANGAKGGGISLPVSLLGILTMGAFTVAEQFMAYKGPNHSVTLIDTGFRISFLDMNHFFEGFKNIILYGSARRCQSVF